MAIEYINRISFKKDGVYVSTKSSNDNCPYHSLKLDNVSEIYLNEGKAKAQLELAKMFMDCCEPRGSHKSLDMYYEFLYSGKMQDNFAEFIQKSDAIYSDFKKAHPNYDMRNGLLGDWKVQLAAIKQEHDNKIMAFFEEYEKTHSLKQEISK